MLELNLLPVAEGDCIHLRFESDDGIWRNIIIDSGPASAAGTFRHLLNRIKESKEMIDLLCFTHIDDDHIKGAEKVLSDPEFDASVIRWIWLNLPHEITDRKAANTNSIYRPVSVLNSFRLWNSICLHKIPCLTEVTQGCAYRIGDMTVQAVLPEKERLQTFWNEWNKQANEKGIYYHRGAQQKDRSIFNGSSIALLCTYRDINLLLTGDAFAEDIVKIRKSLLDVPFHIVKLPHHGSSANISMEMLEALGCHRFLVSTIEKDARPSEESFELLNGYGRQSEQVTVYGNYHWRFMQKEYDHLNIIKLEERGREVTVEGVRVYCEK